MEFTQQAQADWRALLTGHGIAALALPFYLQVPSSVTRISDVALCCCRACPCIRRQLNMRMPLAPAHLDVFCGESRTLQADEGPTSSSGAGSSGTTAGASSLPGGSAHGGCSPSRLLVQSPGHARKAPQVQAAPSRLAPGGRPGIAITAGSLSSQPVSPPAATGEVAAVNRSGAQGNGVGAAAAAGGVQEGDVGVELATVAASAAAGQHGKKTKEPLPDALHP